MNRRGGNDFLNACCQCDAHAAGIGANSLTHMGQQFVPFGEPSDAGVAMIMAKRNDAYNAVNAAVPGIIRICAVVDVVFGGDGGIILGDIFLRIMVVNNANTAVLIASIGFKNCKVMWVGLDGAALNENERVRMPSAMLGIDDAETFIRHGVGLSLGSAATAAALF